MWCDFKRPFVLFHPPLVHQDQVRVLWGRLSRCLLLDEWLVTQHSLRYMLLLLQCSSAGLCWSGLVFILLCKCVIKSLSHKWITWANDFLHLDRSLYRKMEKCGKHRCPGIYLSRLLYWRFLGNNHFLKLRMTDCRLFWFYQNHNALFFPFIFFFSKDEQDNGFFMSRRTFMSLTCDKYVYCIT